MLIPRRSFLLMSLTAGLLASSRRLLAALISSDEPASDPAYWRCLEAWVDALLPADEYSPGAGELGIPASLADKTIRNPGYLKLVKSGCRWLDQQARDRGARDFAALDESKREIVVRSAEQSAPRSLPRMFFERTRDDTFLFYYARPESWVMLGYKGPPQPLGFMDYTRPPSA